MLFAEKSIKDKLGRTVILRNARPEDSADLIRYLKTTSAETPYLIREPDEITMDTTFVDDLGADSLDLYQIILGVEEEFNLDLEEENLEEIVSVGDAVHLIGSAK